MGLNKLGEEHVESPEVRLVERAARGEGEARRALFEQYRGPAYQVAFRIVRRREDALDVVQDGFIKAFENLGRFEGAAGFKTWFFRIVTNTALDQLRRRKVRRAVPLDGGDDEAGPLDFIERGDEDGPGEAMERRELGERLGGAIESLSPDQRAAFGMYASGEMTYAQIAEAAGIPIGTVMSRIYHARRRLVEMLSDLAPQAGKGSSGS